MRAAAIPVVGVVVRTRDRPFFLDRSLRSLAAQTCASWEAVVVNDGGSPAAVREVLAQDFCARLVEDGRIRVIDHEASLGRGPAFNAGLRSLSTEHCAGLDDDDAGEPVFQSRMVEGFEHLASRFPNMGGVCGELVDIDEVLVAPAATPGGRYGEAFSREVGRRSEPGFNAAEGFVSPLRYLLRRHNLLPVQLLLDRERFARFGGFSEAHEVLEDRATLSHFLCEYRIGVVKGAVALHYVRQDIAGTDAAGNAVRDVASHEWGPELRGIETSLFYEPRTSDPAASRLVFLLHDLADLAQRDGTVLRPLLRGMRGEIWGSVRRRKGAIAAALAGFILLQLAIIVLGALIAARILA